MTYRIRLLAAVAAIALPAAMAGAQTIAPASSAPRPTTGAVTPPVQAPVTPTTNTATEDVQESATPTPTPTTAPDPVDANAEPATQVPPTEAVTTQAQTATTPPTPPAAQPPVPAVPAQAEAQTQVQAQAQAPADAGPTVLATAADIRTGIQVVDQTGGAVGTIESVDATGAVVATGTVRAKLPLTSFGRNNQGLVISLTRAQLEAAAQQAAPTPS